MKLSFELYVLLHPGVPRRGYGFAWIRQAPKPVTSSFEKALYLSLPQCAIQTFLFSSVPGCVKDEEAWL